MPKKKILSDDNSPERMLEVLRDLLAIELWKLNVNQTDIAKIIGVKKGRVNSVLKLLPKRTRKVEDATK